VKRVAAIEGILALALLCGACSPIALPVLPVFEAGVAPSPTDAASFCPRPTTDGGGMPCRTTCECQPGFYCWLDECVAGEFPTYLL
jgi:hypothetical protein